MSHRHLRWHAGLLYKIKSYFSSNLYAIIKSYLLQKIFRVKYGEAVMQLKEINCEVPQGSVLGPMHYHYLLYTADLPIALGTTTATYADDAAILAAHNNHIEVQESLFYIQK